MPRIVGTLKHKGGEPAHSRRPNRLGLAPEVDDRLDADATATGHPEVALQVGEDNAATELTIDAVAARAGVARAQVQRRFGTPTRVLEALRRIKACAAFDPQLDRALRTRELERRVGLRRFAGR